MYRRIVSDRCHPPSSWGPPGALGPVSAPYPLYVVPVTALGLLLLAACRWADGSCWKAAQGPAPSRWVGPTFGGVHCSPHFYDTSNAIFWRKL